jgi:hypothetical protein
VHSSSGIPRQLQKAGSSSMMGMLGGLGGGMLGGLGGGMLGGLGGGMLGGLGAHTND